MKKIRVINAQPKLINCCAYARVSTFKDEQESSLMLQESFWEEKLKNLPNRRFCGIFSDQGISGLKVLQRKEYCKMIELAKAGFIDEIYTKSIYRFGRNANETMQVIQDLRQKGVAIIFDEEEINTLTCSQDIILKLKAVLAEQELRTMSKNVQFTTRNNFKNGIVPKVTTFGYDFDESNKMIINEEEAKIIRLIFSLYLKGTGANSIVKQLKKLSIATCYGNETWNTATIYRILRNEKYIGDALLQKAYKQNGAKIKNTGQIDQYYITNDHEAIIDRETFQLVQELLIKRKEQFNAKEYKRITHSLTSKIECGICHKRFVHKTNKRIVNFDNNIWRCATKDKLGKSECNSNDIPESLLKEIILDCYNEYVTTKFEVPCDIDIKDKIAEQQYLRERVKQLYLDKLITYLQYKIEIDKIDVELNKLLDIKRNYNIQSLYRKPKTTLNEFDDRIIDHIENIVIKGYKITVLFKNTQSIEKEFKYEHRKYSKNY